MCITKKLGKILEDITFKLENPCHSELKMAFTTTIEFIVLTKFLKQGS